MRRWKASESIPWERNIPPVDSPFIELLRYNTKRFLVLFSQQ
jgi:hypothetical protein